MEFNVLDHFYSSDSSIEDIIRNFQSSFIDFKLAEMNYFEKNTEENRLSLIHYRRTFYDWVNKLEYFFYAKIASPTGPADIIKNRIVLAHPIYRFSDEEMSIISKYVNFIQILDEQKLILNKKEDEFKALLRLPNDDDLFTISSTSLDNWDSPPRFMRNEEEIIKFRENIIRMEENGINMIKGFIQEYETHISNLKPSIKIIWDKLGDFFGTEINVIHHWNFQNKCDKYNSFIFKQIKNYIISHKIREHIQSETKREFIAFLNYEIDLKFYSYSFESEDTEQIFIKMSQMMEMRR